MKPIIGFVGFSGSGKTTLIEKLLPLLISRYANIAVIKSTHHRIDFDQPGKDSYRYRLGGANCVVLATPNATLQWQARDDRHEDLATTLSSLPIQSIDLIVFEGFKTAAFPKIIVYRSERGEFDTSLLDSHCVAIACDSGANLNCGLENTNIIRLDLNQPQQIAEFIKSRIANA